MEWSCCWQGMEGTGNMMAYMGVYYIPKTWKHCPICGTPRPKEKTLEEKLFECQLDEKKYKGLQDCPQETKEWYKQLAEIARKHFEEKKS